MQNFLVEVGGDLITVEDGGFTTNVLPYCLVKSIRRYNN